MNKNPLLLIDIGNTAMTYTVYSGGRFSPIKTALHNKIPKLVKNWSISGKLNHNNIAICSTVPKMTQLVQRSLPQKNRGKIAIVGGNLEPKISHKYQNINKLGPDRQLLIYGALRIFKPPFALIDFGTAITLDYIAPSGTFVGGMIIPGPELAFQSLINRAALISSSLRLPKKRTSFLGDNTYKCLQSGILEGYGSMITELIQRLRRRYGKRVRIIATGGFSPHLKPFIRGINTYDPTLLLKSLLLLYKDQAPKR